MDEVNFHASRAFDTVSLSRRTHVAKAGKRLLVGMTNQRLFLSSLVLAASRSISPAVAELHELLPILEIAPEEVGAGDQDLQQTHRTRCARLCQWVQTKSFFYTLAISETTESIADDLQYIFLGHDGKVATVADIIHRSASPVALCLGKIWTLLSDWSCSRTGPWKVLMLTGWTDYNDSDARRSARRHCLCLAAGIALRYEIKYANLPFSLGKLTSEVCLIMLSSHHRDRCMYIFTVGH